MMGPLPAASDGECGPEHPPSNPAAIENAAMRTPVLIVVLE